MYTIQFDRSMTKWSDQMFVFYIDRIETSDRKMYIGFRKVKLSTNIGLFRW